MQVVTEGGGREGPTPPSASKALPPPPPYASQPPPLWISQSPLPPSLPVSHGRVQDGLLYDG